MRSRVSGSRCRNCHSTMSPEDTSTTESSPNPTRATDPATTPAVIAIDGLDDVPGDGGAGQQLGPAAESPPVLGTRSGGGHGSRFVRR